jgi:hypothetical protein
MKRRGAGDHAGLTQIRTCEILTYINLSPRLKPHIDEAQSRMDGRMTYFGLTEWGVINWALVVVALFAVGGATRWVLEQLPKQRMVRCPDTKAVSWVETQRHHPESDTPRILSCDLWLQHEACSRGCLSHDRGARQMEGTQ